jgi:hypothetical protein
MVRWIDIQGAEGLLTIDGIIVEELLDLIGDFGGRVVRGVIVLLALAVDAPVVHQPLEHAVRAELVQFAQSPEDGQLRVGHAHVCRFVNKELASFRVVWLGRRPKEVGEKNGTGTVPASSLWT